MINGGRLKPLSGEPLSGGSPRAQGKGPGSGTRPRALLGDTQGEVACRVCRVTVQLGH